MALRPRLMLATLSLLAAPLLAAAPAGAAPAPLDATGIAQRDPVGDQTVFRKAAPARATSSVDLRRVDYAVVNRNGMEQFRVRVVTKRLLPANKEFKQTFNVTASTADNTDGFIIFYTPNNLPTVYTPDTVRSPACEYTETASAHGGSTPDRFTVFVPTACFSLDAPVRLRTAGVLTRRDNGRTGAQDTTRLTRQVTIG